MYGFLHKTTFWWVKVGTLKPVFLWEEKFDTFFPFGKPFLPHMGVKRNTLTQTALLWVLFVSINYSALDIQFEEVHLPGHTHTSHSARVLLYFSIRASVSVGNDKQVRLITLNRLPNDQGGLTVVDIRSSTPPLHPCR